jgi:N,N'-diacetyllegionaminate synthase
MVRSIRNIEIALGDGTKKPTKSEKKNIKIVRKSIVAKNNIKKGEKFDATNITTKRPGTGIPPTHWKKLLGRISSRDYVKDEFIK